MLNVGSPGSSPGSIAEAEAEEEEEAEAEKEAEEEEEAEEAEEMVEMEAGDEVGARDAACECICALDGDPDGSQPVELEESPAAPPSRTETDAMIRGDDHDTLRPLYPTAV